MNKKTIFYGIIVSTLMSLIIFFLGYNYDTYKNAPKELYQVYLDGKAVGVINNEEALYSLIDKEQENLKTDFKVNKIYPPNNLEITKVLTYKEKVNEVKDVYDKIKDTESFTIKGYEVKIDRESEEEQDITFNILNKDDLKTAIDTVVKTFVDEETYESYLKGTQETDFDEGTILEKVNIGEEITVKEKYISTDDKIYKTPKELSRYILFGTDKVTNTYTVKSGDTIKSIANASRLNVKEFLLVNPNLVGENALLFPGQVVNVDLVKPLVTIILETTETGYQEIAYETQVKYDNNMTYGMTVVEQEGVKGVNKVTFRKEIKNGLITNAIAINTEEISPAVNEIVIKGGYNVIYVGDSTYWAWPTLKPYVITSEWGWREEGWHAGVDISGTGYGSPIFSIQNGTVTDKGYSASMGYFVYVDHHNDYISAYLHLAQPSHLNVGDTVEKGQIVGGMGSTGRSTGTHLHLGVFYGGEPVPQKNDIDPLELYR